MGKADSPRDASYKSNTLSVTITGTVPDTVRASTPMGLMVSGVGVGSVSLSWNPSTDNVGVVGYRIYNSVTNVQLGATTTTSGTATGLAPGTHSFYVKAIDAAGNLSFRSNIVSATVLL